MSNDKKAIENYLKTLKDEKEVVTVELRTFDGSNDKYTIELHDHKGGALKKVKREAFIVLFERHLLVLEKGRGKFVFSTHYLNLKEIAAKDDPDKDSVRITFYGKGDCGDTDNSTSNPSISPDEHVTLLFSVLQSESKHFLVNSLYGFYARTFPACPAFFEKRFTQVSASMLEPVSANSPAKGKLRNKSSSIAGGYYNAYRAMCEWAGVPMNKELVWDLRHMYLSKRARDFNTAFMNGKKLSSRALMPVFSVLGLNDYFTSLHVSDVAIDRETSNSIGWMFRNNRTLTDISFVRCGLNGTTLAAIVDPIISSTSKLPLTSLDLSSNMLGDKGFGYVANIIRGAEFRLTTFKLANCNGTNSGLTLLLTAFLKNPGLTASLRTLDLSHNNFGTEAIARDLADVLSRGKIEKLILRGAKVDFDGFSSHKVDIEDIDLSGNNLALSKSLNGFTKIINKSTLIKKLSISRCALGIDNIDYIWKSTTRMNKLEELDISDNMYLGVEGVTMLIKKISPSKTLKRLNISNCFSKGQKHVKELVDALKMYSSSDSFPTHFKMAGGEYPLGKDLLEFVSGLIENKRVEYIDIS